MVIHTGIRAWMLLWFCSGAVLVTGCSDTTNPASPSTAASLGTSEIVAPLGVRNDTVAIIESYGVEGNKVSLCHATGNGTYVRISISVAAESAHREHGDAAVGENVPGQPGHIFDNQCMSIALPCALSVTPTSGQIPALGGGEVLLTVAADPVTCVWNVSIDSDWLFVFRICDGTPNYGSCGKSQTGGTGPALVWVDANGHIGPARTAIVKFTWSGGGVEVPVVQSASPLAIP